MESALARSMNMTWPQKAPFLYRFLFVCQLEIDARAVWLQLVNSPALVTMAIVFIGSCEDPFAGVGRWSFFGDGPAFQGEEWRGIDRVLHSLVVLGPMMVQFLQSLRRKWNELVSTKTLLLTFLWPPEVTRSLTSSISPGLLSFWYLRSIWLPLGAHVVPQRTG